MSFIYVCICMYVCMSVCVCVCVCVYIYNVILYRAISQTSVPFDLKVGNCLQTTKRDTRGCN